MNLTIVGGGSSAHVLIPFLSKLECNVNLITSRPKEWNDVIHMEYKLSNGDTEFEMDGKLDNASNDAYNFIPDSDIIIFCMPVNQYRVALDRIAPYINKDKQVFLGVLYGQGGFNWMVDAIARKYNLHNLCYFAVGLMPWICRYKEYGKSGITYGCKSNNVVAVYPKNQFEYLNKSLLNDICFEWFKKGKFVLADNFISLTLSVDNQIIHPSRLHALSIEDGVSWENENDIPYFYRDYSIKSGEILKALDNDYSKIRDKIKSKYPEKKFRYMLNYLDLEHFSYNSSSSNIVDSFINSKTLSLIKTPVVKENNIFVINRNHRFFYDDIFYGLCIAKWFAQNMSLEVKTIDGIIRWAEKELECKILLDNELYYSNELPYYLYGTPDFYGIKNLDRAID